MKLGTAAWADPADVAADHVHRPGRIWLGRLEDNTAVGYRDDRHVCLVSGSRSGKGTSCIVNNLALWPGSIVVVDPKGENATVTAARRGSGSDGCQGIGQQVHVLDPFGAAHVEDKYRSRFNPLDALDPTADETIDEASRLADALVVVREDSKDPFWDESARALIKGLILHVLTAPHLEGRRNLVTLRTLVTRGDWEAVEALRESGEPDVPSGQALLWTDIQRSTVFNGILAGIGDTFLNMYRNSPKQFESVLQVANRNTEFLDSPAMQRSLEASDFRLSDLKTRPEGMSLYLSLPQRYMATHYRWLRMMIALATTEMEIVRGRPASGHPVLMVLDEFAGLKRMEVIENAVAQIAGHGVKLFFVLQSLEQLKATYKDNWETFLANAGLKIFFGVEDHFSREYVSKLVGETEVVREVHSSGESVTESQSKSVGTSRSTSEGYSESTGTTTSRGQTQSAGTNQSRSDSVSSGTNRSTSKSWGRSTGWSWTDPGLLYFGNVEMNRSRGKNKSQSVSEGTSEGRSTSQSHGTSQGYSESVTGGSSYTRGTTYTTTEGVSETETEGTSTGRTSGTSETVHKRALISPDEVGQVFAAPRRRGDPAYPGLALVVIAGARPFPVRRTNYFEDPEFIGRYEGHPEFTRPEIATATLAGEAIVALRPRLPGLRFVPLSLDGSSVLAGETIGHIVGRSDADFNEPVLAAATGRVTQLLGVPANADPPAVAASVMHYVGEKLIDPLSAVVRRLGESEVAAEDWVKREAARARAVLEELDAARNRWVAATLLVMVFTAYASVALGQTWLIRSGVVLAFCVFRMVKALDALSAAQIGQRLSTGTGPSPETGPAEAESRTDKSMFASVFAPSDDEVKARPGFVAAAALVVIAAFGVGGFIFMRQAAVPSADNAEPPRAAPVRRPESTPAAALGSGPENAAQKADTVVAKANALMDEERYMEALPLYEQAVELRPADADLRTDLAVCYYYADDHDRALTQLGRSLQINPTHTKALFNLGIVRAFGKGDMEGAADAWRKVRELAPESAEGKAATDALQKLGAAPSSP